MVIFLNFLLKMTKHNKLPGTYTRTNRELSYYQQNILRN